MAQQCELPFSDVVIISIFFLVFQIAKPYLAYVVAGDVQAGDHGRVPEKVVAFEGMNTGRWFYVCAQHNVSISS
jgi:hypothetical protein